MKKGKVEKMVSKLPLLESLFSAKCQSSRWDCTKHQSSLQGFNAEGDWLVARFDWSRWSDSELIDIKRTRVILNFFSLPPYRVYKEERGGARRSGRVIFHPGAWSSSSVHRSWERSFLLLACSVGVCLVRHYCLTLGGLLRDFRSGWWLSDFLEGMGSCRRDTSTYFRDRCKDEDCHR